MKWLKRLLGLEKPAEVKVETDPIPDHVRRSYTTAHPAHVGPTVEGQLHRKRAEGRRQRVHEAMQTAQGGRLHELHKEHAHLTRQIDALDTLDGIRK